MFNWWTFVFEIINFAVVVFILYRLLFKPVREILAKREEAIELSRSEIEKGKRDVQNLKVELDGRLKELEEIKRATIEEARVEALKNRERILNETKIEVDRERERMRRQIENERNKLYEEIKEKSIDISAELSERIISSVVDKGMNETLVDRVLEKIRDLPEGEKTKIVDPSKKICLLQVTSSHPLPEGSIAKIKNTVGSAFNCIPDIQYHEVPELICGVLIRINSKIFDSTIKGNIDRIVNELKEQV